MDKYSKVLIRWTIFSNAVPFAIRSRWTIMSIAICINNFNLVGQLSNNVMLLLRWTIVQQCYVTSCHLGGQLSTATFFLQYGLGGQLSIPTCINSCNLAGQLSNNVMLLLRWTFVQQCYVTSCHLGGQLSTATFFLQEDLAGQLSIAMYTTLALAGQLANNVMLLRVIG